MRITAMQYVLRHLTIVAVAVLCGCGTVEPRYTNGVEDDAQLHATILQHVPPHMPVLQAIAFMEGEGFSCQLVSDGVYIQPHGESSGAYVARSDVLKMNSKESTEDIVWWNDVRADLEKTNEVREVEFLRCDRFDRRDSRPVIGRFAPHYASYVIFVIENV